MPWTDPNNLLWLLAGKKNAVLFGIGMVTEKIRTHPDYRMWATIGGMLTVVVLPVYSVITTVQATIDGRVAEKLAPMRVEISHLQEFHDYGERYSKSDAARDKLDTLDRMKIDKQHDHDRIVSLGLRILRIENQVIKR